MARLNTDGQLGPEPDSLNATAPSVIPKYYPVQYVGDSVSLYELGWIMAAFNISRYTAVQVCKSLEIPLIHMGRNAYFNFSTLERTLFVLCKPGGPGFAAPGSKFKNKAKHKSTGTAALLTPEQVIQRDDPRTIAEMGAVGTRGSAKAQHIANFLKSGAAPQQHQYHSPQPPSPQPPATELAGQGRQQQKAPPIKVTK